MNNKNINIMFIGEQKVGKTSYIIKLTQNRFDDVHTETLGVDFFYTHIAIKKKNYSLHIYDASGSSMFEKMVNGVYSKIDAFVIMYDVTNKISFDNVPKWYAKIKTNNIYNNIPILLLGNKIDLLSLFDRCISLDNIKKYTLITNMLYDEISAKNDDMLHKPLEILLKKPPHLDKKKIVALWFKKNIRIKLFINFIQK